MAKDQVMGPSKRERELAASCIDEIGEIRLGSIERVLALYRDELARDPVFILTAAKALLREAGATMLELLYWDRGASDCLTLRDRHHDKVAHAARGDLAGACAKLVEVRRG